MTRLFSGNTFIGRCLGDWTKNGIYGYDINHVVGLN